MQTNIIIKAGQLIFPESEELKKPAGTANGN